MAAFTVVAHLLIAGNYGWMRDEMYYVEAGKHLSGGYVEFPMMVALLADIQRALFGTSLMAIHVLPAFAGAGVIVLTGLMAREMGGGRTAQMVAGLSVLVAPGFFGADSLFTMDAFDELWWIAGAYVIIRLLATYDPGMNPPANTRATRRNLWLLFGLICGVGLLTKLTILAFGLAVVLGLLTSSARREFRTLWPYVAGVLAFAFLTPYVIWNADNNWATLAFWHTYSHGQDAATFLIQVLLLMQPLSLPLWIAGLTRLLRQADARPYRPLAVGWLFLLVLFLVGHAKSYFFIPAFPPLVAAGCVSLEQIALRRPRARLVGASVTALILGGIVLAPVVAPILPPKTLSAVDSSPIQPVADKFGWPQMVATVAKVLDGLPANQRRHATVVAGNYGEAAALTLFGGPYHLPRVISPDNTFWFWGRDVTPKGTVITMDLPSRELHYAFRSIRQAGRIPSEDGIQNEEVGRPVWVCRGFKRPWPLIWKELQDFS